MEKGLPKGYQRTLELFSLHVSLPQTPNAAIIIILCNKSRAGPLLQVSEPFIDQRSCYWLFSSGGQGGSGDISGCDICHILALLLRGEKETTEGMTLPCSLEAERLRASSEGWEITFAESGGWSHHEEDETKGHSEP